MYMDFASPLMNTAMSLLVSAIRARSGFIALFSACHILTEWREKKLTGTLVASSYRRNEQ